jgi:GT2 family glycosyltransferase
MNLDKPKLAVILAFHDRKEMTLNCIKSIDFLFSKNWSVEYYFADDGSSDGTKEEVLKLRISSHFVIGDGSWYWAKSMALAEGLVNSDPDAVLWVNDDVKLDLKAVTSDFLLKQINANSVYVGRLHSSLDENDITYGPVNLHAKHPLRILTREQNIRSPYGFDSFNGNFVFIPSHIWKTVGTIDGKFSHAFADFDYGLRVRKLGFGINCIPFPVGICDRNPEVRLTVLEVIRHWNHPKILPVSSNLRYLRKHGGSFSSGLVVLYFLGIIKRIVTNS